MSDQIEVQGPVGVGLFVAAYVDERRADETLETLKRPGGAASSSSMMPPSCDEMPRGTSTSMKPAT